MANLVTIGDFSRMSFLSVKTLRHYHDVGLLKPADVDAYTSYRRYSTDQLADAQVILRLRGFGMPLEEIRQVLNASDVETRNAAIISHLQRMETRLAETRSAVQSLRQLLQADTEPLVVEHRHLEPCWALTVSTNSSIQTGGPWLNSARRTLADALSATGLQRSGPDGSLYFAEFFTDSGFADLDEVVTSKVVAFVPVGLAPGEPDDDFDLGAGIELSQLPAAELAVTTHHGSCTELDRSYARLGTYVTERAIGVAGPIREHHLDPVDAPDEGLRTEVCWPVFRLQ
ncbi:MerR family transcriptional regulator [Microlunatus sp. Gsoil 973]|uniref:MerR family transcriptional regulator n=1 Tax=Microlunatus sp. Gsoil 973 TaxID=2672569 RepID=UPI0018A86621|nr:MerR family transcriptional regulator [Microlunatus sp. Gsoil 973]